ncbi:MAG: CBS domain-containing protein, partial [Neisseriaceae bacterium]|nr:CBS domain-containing protein [Neisseriaceae bacterium]
VEDVMVKEDAMPVESADATLKDVIIVMTNKGLGLAIIINAEKQVLGIFTDGDLRRLFQNEQEIKNLVIEDIMISSPKTISKDILASEALHLMQEHKIASLLVVNENNQLLGVSTMHQLLSAGII